MTQLSRRQVANYVACQLANETNNVQQMAKQVAGYLLATKQTRQSQLMINDILTALKQYGFFFASVTTATELNNQLKQQINIFLNSKTDANNIQLEHKIDPKIKGGVIINTADNEYDFSLQSKLDRLRSLV